MKPLHLNVKLGWTKNSLSTVLMDLKFRLPTIWCEAVCDFSIAFRWECFVPRGILINFNHWGLFSVVWERLVSQQWSSKCETQCCYRSWEGWTEALNMMDYRVVVKLWQVQHIHSGHKNTFRITKSIGKVMNTILNDLHFDRDGFWKQVLAIYFTGNNLQSSCVPKSSHVTLNSGPPTLPLDKYFLITRGYLCTQQQGDPGQFSPGARGRISYSFVYWNRHEISDWQCCSL